jgi:hypothetical protein
MILAQAIDAASTTAKHTVGQIWEDRATSKKYVYVLASEALAIGNCCAYGSNHSAALSTKALADAMQSFGIALCTIASASYGWLQIYGNNAAIMCDNGCIANPSGLYNAVTAGRLGSTTTGTTKILGIYISSVCVTAGSNVAGFINYPKAAW